MLLGSSSSNVSYCRGISTLLSSSSLSLARLSTSSKCSAQRSANLAASSLPPSYFWFYAVKLSFSHALGYNVISCVSLTGVLWFCSPKSHGYGSKAKSTNFISARAKGYDSTLAGVVDHYIWKSASLLEKETLGMLLSSVAASIFIWHPNWQPKTLTPLDQPTQAIFYVGHWIHTLASSNLLTDILLSGLINLL